MTKIRDTRFVVSVLFFLFFVILQSLCAQTSQNFGDMSENEILLSGTESSALNVLQTNSKDKGSITGTLVRFILVLVFLIAGVYIAIHLIKKSKVNTSIVDPYIKNPASYSFSPSKSVQLITIGNRAFLLGLSEQSISLLTEIDDRELIDTILFEADKKPAVQTSFTNILHSFLTNQKATQEKKLKKATFFGSNVESFAAQDTSDFIKQQRERLHQARNKDGTEEPQ